MGSIKEGIAEELEREENEKLVNKEDLNIEDKKKVDDIPYNESFGTALGNPFRIVIFGEWFTLFNIKDDDEKYPVHLYKFGSYPNFEKFQPDFIKLLNRDFGINDRESFVDVVSSYFDIARIDKNETILSSSSSNIVDDKMWNIDKQGVKALLSAVLSYQITGAADAGFIDKSDAIKILDKVSAFAKEHYNDWEKIGDDFLIGESSVKLNNGLGSSLLKKYIGYLKTKKGSPWNNIQW